MSSILLLAPLFLTPGALSGVDGAPVKRAVGDFSSGQAGANVLKANAWRPWKKGFTRQGEVFVCDNGSDTDARRGVSQTVELNQTSPDPIVAIAWSKAQGVEGGRDSNYALYLDLKYTDGSELWGQTAPFDVGTHDWQKRRVVVFPAKPIQSVAFHMLMRRHSGKAWFRNPSLRVLSPKAGATVFDGVVVSQTGEPTEGFQVRDVAADGDFVRIRKQALGLRLTCKRSEQDGATFFDVTLADTTGKDRAVTLYYTLPISGDGWRWLLDPRRDEPVASGREYMNAVRFNVGANGRMSRYPLAAIAQGAKGQAIGIDLARPAFYRIGFNAGARELFIAYDIGLAPEKPTARLRFCRFDFDAKWGFRSALDRYYSTFPDHFRCRTPEQGLWMPFAKISKVKGWRDFGFKFKEGNNETTWDDRHDIITLRYTEPMTWWMRMPKDMPRNYETALAYAQEQAAKGKKWARAFQTSAFHDEQGRFCGLLRDTPWCNGAVWSMNSMPGVVGEMTDFKVNWGKPVREQLYGPKRKGDLEGEYIDSSEGYVTAELNFRREHFRIADTPLAYSLDSRRPAIFRGLVTFEYVRAIANDVHAMGKLMMANSTPIRLPWLAPLLEVMGTETNWNHGGKWRPMSDSELLYRRVMCRTKPYCFLMNTPFEKFSHALVEKYMKRALAYGMFPGFFSHNASQGHYFTRPELYDRDRPLFKKYVPLCRRVAEAGWTPVTLARSSDPRVYVERFGARCLTVFNDTQKPKRVTIRLDDRSDATATELLSGRKVVWRDGTAELALAPEDVAVLELD